MTALVCLFLTLYVLVLFARILMSWFPINPSSPLGPVQSALFSVTEPVLAPVRNTVPSLSLGSMRLDLSPLIVLFAVRILRSFIC